MLFSPGTRSIRREGFGVHGGVCQRHLLLYDRTESSGSEGNEMSHPSYSIFVKQRDYQERIISPVISIKRVRDHYRVVSPVAVVINANLVIEFLWFVYHLQASSNLPIPFAE